MEGILLVLLSCIFFRRFSNDFFGSLSTPDFVHFLANSALLPFGQPQNGPGGLGQDIFSKYLQANTLGEWH